VKGVTFKDSQKMHLRFSNVQDGTADGIQITAPSNSPNTDGIHVSESSNIVIANCDITTGNGEKKTYQVVSSLGFRVC
jgi:galacturan 1,4-alpha-galacturonidase